MRIGTLRQRWTWELISGIEKRKLQALIGGQMHGLVVWMRMIVIRPTILWNDSRTAEGLCI